MIRMVSPVRRALATSIVMVTMAGLLSPVTAQAPIDVYELADYRLTTEVFEIPSFPAIWEREYPSAFRFFT